MLRLAARNQYRELAAHAGLHRRTPGIVADLFIGWQFFTFAHEAEALTRGEAEIYRARVWNALIEVAHRQSDQPICSPVMQVLVLPLPQLELLRLVRLIRKICRSGISLAD
jgi:hypothetical protein